MSASLPPVESLVESTFGRLCTDVERAELCERIRVWDAQNASRPTAERVIGWIDVAYRFQAERGFFRDGS